MNQPSITQLVSERCRLLGLSERTAETYAAALNRFERWLGSPAISASPEQASVWLLASSRTQRTAYHQRCALAFLFVHLRGEAMDERVLPRMRQPKPRVPVLLDPHEVARLLAALADPEIRRLGQFVYATGLRRREALAVRIEDLDERGGTLLVRHGKGGRQRRTILPRSLAAILQRLRRNRLPAALLFASQGGELPLDRIETALREARRAAGIAKPATMHALRRAFATHLHERGVGVCELRHLLGHASVVTTMGYLGLREDRRFEIAQVGDLLAALPEVTPGQQNIAWG